MFFSITMPYTTVMITRILAAATLFLLLPAFSFAYEATKTDQTNPFELLVVEDITANVWYVDTLNDFPHTFEFLLTEPTAFTAQVMTLSDADVVERPSLILVKEVNRGVEEVMRRTGTTATWEDFQDPVSNIQFVQSESFTQTLEPGVYRFEVSNPDNSSVYVLKVGTDNPAGYGTNVRNVFLLRSELGFSTLGSFFNGYILMPLFILFSIVFFGWFVWRKKYTQ